MTAEQNPRIMEYLQSVKDRIHPSQLQGYLPVDDIIAAYTKGEEDGEKKSIERLRENITNQLAQHFLYSQNIFRALLEKEYSIESFYISAVNKKTIFVTTVENTIDDNFISFFFDQAISYEESFRKAYHTSIQFSFIANESIDEEELECDSFVKFEIA